MVDFSPMPGLFNQTDRIRGMASYMNSDGASSEWFTLLTIVTGMVLLILVLKIYAGHKRKLREQALRKKMRQRRREAKRAAKEQRKPVVRRKS